WSIASSTRGFATTQGDTPYLIRTYAPRPQDQDEKRSLFKGVTFGSDVTFWGHRSRATQASAVQRLKAAPHLVERSLRVTPGSVRQTSRIKPGSTGRVSQVASPSVGRHFTAPPN